MKLIYQYLYVAMLIAPAVACAAPSNPNAVSTDDAPQPAQSSAEGLTGEIKDENGRPVNGAMITPKSRDAGGPAIPEIAILSDATGRYRWALRPGRYDVTVTAEGYEDVTREATVSPGAIASLDFVLRRSK